MARASRHTQFAERLRKYGLTPDDVHAEILHVGKGGMIHLGTLEERRAFHGPRLLQCKDIDDVKTWLGVPDAIFQKNPKLADNREPRSFPPSSLVKELQEGLRGLEAAKTKAEEKRISHELRDLLCPFGPDLSRLSYHYIFGDSRPLKKWKRVLELPMLEQTIPIWLYNVVVVEAGAVLEFGRGVSVLSADELIIHPGGTIRAHGALTIDVGQMKRPN